MLYSLIPIPCEKLAIACAQPTHASRWDMNGLVNKVEGGGKGGRNVKKGETK